MSSIDQNKSGTWRVRYKGSNGKRTTETFEDRNDAEIFALEVELHQKKYGVSPSSKRSEKTFNMYVDYWLKYESNNLGDINKYTSIINCHLKPRFGEVLLSDITSELISSIWSDLKQKGRADKTIWNTLTLLQTLLNKAHGKGFLREVPIISKPKLIRHNSDYRFLNSKEQVNEFLEKSREDSESTYMAYLFTLNTGLRLGEVCGLKWSNVDFSKRLIRVSKSYSGPTKNRKTRFVPIFKTLFDQLLSWKEKSHQFSEYVFPNRFGGMHKSGARFSQEILKRILGKCSFQKEFERYNPNEYYITFHGLRHTFASQYVMSGRNVYNLKEYLGHSSIETTKIYAHLSPDHYQEDFNCFDSLYLDDNKVNSSSFSHVGL